MRLILLLLLVATSDMVFRPGVERCPLATLGCPLMILLLHEGPIEAFVPRLAFAILLGLSMDHEVFVTSRIPEEHVHGLKTQGAVEHSIAASVRVVVAAALITGTVFAAFILSASRIPKKFGLPLRSSRTP